MSEPVPDNQILPDFGAFGTEWELTQAAAEWLARRADVAEVGVYLPERPRRDNGPGARSREGILVLRGRHGSGSGRSVPDRLWWKSGPAWVGPPGARMRLFPLALGTETGVVLLGPFLGHVTGALTTAEIDAAVAVVAYSLGEHLYLLRKDRGRKTDLLTAMAIELGRRLDGSPGLLTEALADLLMADDVSWSDGVLTVRGERRPIPPARRVAEHWLTRVDQAPQPEVARLAVLQGLAGLADCRPGTPPDRGPLMAGASILIGRALGLSVTDLRGLELAALLVSVGGVLEGSSVADEGEADARRRRDALVGASLLEGAGFPPRVVEAVRHWPEWWNGQGDPYGLSGQEIPLAARILAVAGHWAYNGVTGLGRAAGRVLDPHLVTVLVDSLTVSGPGGSAAV